MRNLAAACITLFISFGAQAQVVDFQDVPSAGNPTVTDISSGGFRFTSQHFHTIDNPAGPGAVSNGTTYIGHEGGNLGRTITMTRLVGGTFDLSGADIAPIWLNPPVAYPNATAVRIIGHLASGGTDTRILDLSGALAFQTVV